MMTELEDAQPLPKYKYRIVKLGYTEPHESGHFIIQYRKGWWQSWQTDGHWSIGIGRRFYRRTYDSFEEAASKIEQFRKESNEPVRHDEVVTRK